MEIVNPQFELLSPRTCCLMVIDPQERLMKAIHKAERVVANVCLMIKAAKALDVPVIATTQYVKGLGPLVPEIAELTSDVPVVDKVEFNALASEDVRNRLSALPDSVDTILLTGVEAHICVYQTAVGAARLGYMPWIVADAVSSREKRNSKSGLRRLDSLGFAVGPAEMAIYEMLQKAGTPAFKAVLSFIK